jgi:hypothetical protein
VAINWDDFDPFGRLEPDEDYEYDEGYDVDRQIDEMKEEGNWPW